MSADFIAEEVEVLVSQVEIAL